MEKYELSAIDVEGGIDHGTMELTSSTLELAILEAMELLEEELSEGFREWESIQTKRENIAFYVDENEKEDWVEVDIEAFYPSIQVGDTVRHTNDAVRKFLIPKGTFTVNRVYTEEEPMIEATNSKGEIEQIAAGWIEKVRT